MNARECAVEPCGLPATGMLRVHVPMQRGTWMIPACDEHRVVARDLALAALECRDGIAP